MNEPRCKTPGRRGNQRGIVTIELAIGILSLAILTGFLAWVVSLGMVQSRCVDTAAQVARQIARGDEKAAKRAESNVPNGGSVTVKIVGGDVHATAHVDASFLGLGVVPIEGRASYPLEPGER